MFYKRESHMWQISVIDLLNAGEIWTRSISCGVSEGRGRGTNKKKKKILRHQKFIYLCSGALPYVTLFFDSGGVLTAVSFSCTLENIISDHQKLVLGNFFSLPFSAGPISHVDTRSWSPEEWTCRRVSAWDLTSQAFHRVSLLKSINWLLR